MNHTGLPVADSRQTARQVGALAKEYRGQVALTIVLYSFAAAAGLGAPWLLGRLIDSVDTGGAGTVNAIGMAIVGCILVQAVLSGVSNYVSGRFGESVMARLREDFVRRALALPLSTVERAGTGDLMTRSSRDVTELGSVLRRAAPESFVNLITLVLTLIALAVASPLLALTAIVTVVPLLWWPTRWYLKRARPAYLAESAAYSRIAENLAATVDGARTIEALRTQADRIKRGRDDTAGSYRAEMRTLYLRSVLFPALDFSVTVPIASVMLLGGLLYGADLVSLGAVTAAVLYVNQLGEPVFMLVAMLDELQTGDASLGRLIGIGPVQSEHGAETDPDLPRQPGVPVRTDGVHYAYTGGRNVLHGVTLDVAAGERLAVVGPSGAGKSTLGRLIAGIDSPGDGTVTIDGHDVTGLPLPQLRRRVLLVTQEHHVFGGSVRDNLALADPGADDARIIDALTAVDAHGWLEGLPDGLDTQVGSAAMKLDPALAQQLALARLVLADPAVLVLDEATSLLDPRAARHLERHLAAVLEGRTVIAIAHRLHTAHDADRIAVVEAGRIAELGAHHELVAADGHYAKLWRSWQGE